MLVMRRLLFLVPLDLDLRGSVHLCYAMSAYVVMCVPLFWRLSNRFFSYQSLLNSSVCRKVSVFFVSLNYYIMLQFTESSTFFLFGSHVISYLAWAMVLSLSSSHL
jgi:hypothetical protein